MTAQDLESTPHHRLLYIEDAAHGWLQVPRTLLGSLGIADSITSYSYQRDGMVYLEEDLDMTTFWNAYEASYGIAPVFERYYVPRWPGRHYDTYKPAPGIP